MTTRTLTDSIEVQFHKKLRKSGLRLSNAAAYELSKMLRFAEMRASERSFAEADLDAKLSQLLAAISSNVRIRTHDATTLKRQRFKDGVPIFLSTDNRMARTTRTRRFTGARPLVMPSDVHAAMKDFCPCWPFC